MKKTPEKTFCLVRWFGSVDEILFVAFSKDDLEKERVKLSKSVTDNYFKNFNLDMKRAKKNKDKKSLEVYWESRIEDETSGNGMYRIMPLSGAVKNISEESYDNGREYGAEY